MIMTILWIGLAIYFWKPYLAAVPIYFFYVDVLARFITLPQINQYDIFLTLVTFYLLLVGLKRIFSKNDNLTITQLLEV